MLFEKFWKFNSNKLYGYYNNLLLKNKFKVVFLIEGLQSALLASTARADLQHHLTVFYGDGVELLKELFPRCSQCCWIGSYKGGSRVGFKHCNLLSVF